MTSLPLGGIWLVCLRGGFPLDQCDSSGVWSVLWLYEPEKDNWEWDVSLPLTSLAVWCCVNIGLQTWIFLILHTSVIWLCIVSCPMFPTVLLLPFLRLVFIVFLQLDPNLQFHCSRIIGQIFHAEILFHSFPQSLAYPLLFVLLSNFFSEADFFFFLSQGCCSNMNGQIIVMELPCWGFLLWCNIKFMLS